MEQERQPATRGDRRIEQWAWERLAALAGILAVALWIIAIAITESTDLPDEDNAGEILRWYSDDSEAILASGFIFQLGALAFLVFVTALRGRLWWIEGGAGFLSSLAHGAGIAVAVFLLGTPGANMSAAVSDTDLSPEAAQALNNIADVFFIGAELSAAVLVAATGLLAIRLRALPAWLGWLSLVLALLLLIPEIGWVGLAFGVPIWTLIVSVLLFLTKPPPPPGPPPHTAQFTGRV